MEIKLNNSQIECQIWLLHTKYLSVEMTVQWIWSSLTVKLEGLEDSFFFNGECIFGCISSLEYFIMFTQLNLEWTPGYGP